MPARYLLIEFDEEESATLLRAQIDNATRKGKKYRIVGLFAKPGRSCTCFVIAGERAKNRVVRGSKLGWWLCTYCKRPRLGNHELKNLVGPEEIVVPALQAGVDTLHVPVNEIDYLRYPSSISLLTFPGHVASAAQS